MINLFGAEWRYGDEVRPRDAMAWQVMTPSSAQAGFPLGNGHYVSRTHLAALDVNGFITHCGKTFKREGSFVRPDDGKRPRNWCGSCYRTRYTA